MAGLRISGGSLRGRRMPLPTHGLRPTSERARQAFFNIVGDRIDGARFLDLFAGSGIFSFEAVSRGASAACAIESSRKATDAIRERSLALGLPIQVIAADAFAGMKRLPHEEQWNVVYADPPYDFVRYGELLEVFDSQLPLSSDAVIAIEHRTGTSPFDRVELKCLDCERSSAYGEVSITFFEPKDRG